MKILSVTFSGAVAKPGGAPPEGLPQIAFSGRSNVGKSSLINRLLGRHRTPLARVSSTPGKTQEINFYRVRVAWSSGSVQEFFLVDLPGYGFARAPESVRRAWRPLIESYLRGADGLVGVVQLVDARHPPTAQDRQLVEYLAGLELPTLVVTTKVDKLNRAEREASAERVQSALGLRTEQVLAFSARTGEGREALASSLEDLLTEVEA